ncbi:MAG: hypothetical protein FWG66_01725, partial [Spirochaetes bacterium]|nr:hypothetical protein [Spirochaetota bacterium]
PPHSTCCKTNSIFANYSHVENASYKAAGRDCCRMAFLRLSTEGALVLCFNAVAAGQGVKMRCMLCGIKHEVYGSGGTGCRLTERL